MGLKVAGNVVNPRLGQLQELLDEVPEVLQEAILACSAPRHAALDDQANEARESYGKVLRRKWFGKQRGTVRHTFRDILRHIKNNDVLVHGQGSRCHGTAHAYTPDGQKGKIYLCPLFYSDDFFGQISTIIHELTHLVRGTSDFELPDSEKEFSGGLTSESPPNDTSDLKDKFRNYLTELPGKDSVISAYSYEYFIRELLEEVWDPRLVPPVR